MTQHQIGTVLVSASGNRLPDRVASTIMAMPCVAAANAAFKLMRDSEKAHLPACPSVDLK
jgi:hypothetical protein